MSRVRGIVILLLTALVGCNEPTSVDGGLDVSLSTDRQVVTPSTPAMITITVVNRGDRTVKAMDPRGYACMPAYSVATEQGASVPAPSSGFCAAVAYLRVSLEPGESMTIRDTWSGEASDGRLGNTPLPAGRYRLATRVAAGSELLGSAPVVMSVAASN
jgi:hypothetical protein